MMRRPDTPMPRIAYVVKRYPRFSETFIVNEILAHEEAGTAIDIFAIRPCSDTHFQDRIARVRAPLTVIPASSHKAAIFWTELKSAQERYPDLWSILQRERFADELSIWQALQLADQVMHRGIHHIHSHFGTLPTTVARLASALTGVPYSFTAHAKDIFHESVIHDDLQEKLTDAAAVVTVSQFNVVHLTDQFDLPADKVHLIYNGLDLADLPFSQPVHRPRTIVAVGRLVEKKGFHFLIDACRLLADEGHDFQCLIVGDGDQRHVLQKQIDHLQLRDQITLMGSRASAECKRIVQQAAVLAAPCIVGHDGDRDGLPTVLLEAMALGTPCIGTPVTGIPEVIHHGRTGWIVPPEHARNLADALARFLSDGGLRHSLAVAARQLMEQEFDSRRTSRTLRDDVFRHATVSA